MNRASDADWLPKMLAVLTGRSRKMQVNEIESIRVTTDDVMQAIRDYQQKFAIEHFTTREIAQADGCR